MDMLYIGKGLEQALTNFGGKTYDVTDLCIYVY